jgi:hypothetical protein
MPVRRSALVTFEQERKEHEHELIKIARNEHYRHLHHLDIEDILNWMLWELWQACTHFDRTKGDENLTIQHLWWRYWLNRRSKLVHEERTNKRRLNTTALALEDATQAGLADHYIPPCPVPGRLEARIWTALALCGQQKLPYQDIMADLGIDRETLTEILESFRNAKVHDYLTGSGM